MEHIKLSIVDSHRLDIESIVSEDNQHIIFDQSLIDAFNLMTPLVLDHLEPVKKWEFPAEARNPSWLHAHFANRYLAAGMEHEAIIQAGFAAYAQRSEGPSRANPQTVDRWVRVQCAYTVAHELGHCRIGSGDVIARALAQSFEDDMLPYLRQMDEEDPPQYHSETTYSEKDRLRREEFDRLNALHMEELGRPAVSPVFLPYRGMSREELLDWIVSDVTGVGEEVLADFLALSLTPRLTASDEVEYLESLVACISAFRHIMLFRMIEILCTAFDGRLFDGHAINRLTHELELRARFMAYSAEIMLTKQHLRDCRERDLSAEAANATYGERVQAFFDLTNYVETAWKEFLSQLAECRFASTTDALKEQLMTENPGMFEMVRSQELPGLIASYTLIGKP
jgi:hypothetical protein